MELGCLAKVKDSPVQVFTAFSLYRFWRVYVCVYFIFNWRIISIVLASAIQLESVISTCMHACKVTSVMHNSL